LKEKCPQLSKTLTPDLLPGLFRPFVAGLISTRDTHAILEQCLRKALRHDLVFHALPEGLPEQSRNDDGTSTLASYLDR
jgi:hypothetical protein